MKIPIVSESPQTKISWRTKEIEGYSNLYLIHPLSARLTSLFARWGWHPNQVSALGLLSAFAAAVCFYHYQTLLMSILGFAFLLGWHVFDGADGQLARLTNQTSEVGKIVDGICDHAGYGMVYVSLALAIQPLYGPWIWVLAIAAGVSHLIQASALEFHRDNYDCWVHSQLGKCVPALDELKKKSGESYGPFKSLSLLYLFYVQLQYRFAEADQYVLQQEPCMRDHPNRRRLADQYKLRALSTVREWNALSANKRTLAIALCCIIKLPVLFFVYEVFLLNIVLWWLRRRQRRTNAELRRAIVKSC